MMALRSLFSDNGFYGFGEKFAFPTKTGLDQIQQQVRPRHSSAPRNKSSSPYPSGVARILDSEPAKQALWSRQFGHLVSRKGEYPPQNPTATIPLLESL